MTSSAFFGSPSASRYKSPTNFYYGGVSHGIFFFFLVRERPGAYITYIQGMEGDLIHTPVKYILNTRDDTSSAVALTWVHSMQGTYADDLCL